MEHYDSILELSYWVVPTDSLVEVPNNSAILLEGDTPDRVLHYYLTDGKYHPFIAYRDTVVYSSCPGYPLGAVLNLNA